MVQFFKLHFTKWVRQSNERYIDPKSPQNTFFQYITA